MNFLTFDIGQRNAGSVARVTLSGVESDVFLLDSINYQKFQAGYDFRYVGGHYKQSPVALPIPSLGDWTVVVIPTGGEVRASVAVS